MVFESMKDPFQKMLFESIKTSQEDLYQTRNKPVLQRDIFTQLINVVCTFLSREEYSKNFDKQLTWSRASKLDQ